MASESIMAHNHLVIADAYHDMLATAEAMLVTDYQFIFSCKGNYPFKQHTHTLPKMTKQKGCQVWMSPKKKRRM